MAAELAVQTEIRQATVQQKGYAFKLSNRFTIGVPDLGIWLSPFAPFTMEVKDFGEVADKFNRQTGVTPKQRDTMRRMAQPYGSDMWGRRVCGVAVHYRRGTTRFLSLVPWRAMSLASDDVVATIERPRGGSWDIAQLLGDFGAARI